MSQLKAYMDSIGVHKYPSCWESRYEEAMDKVDNGLLVLTPEYLHMLHDKYEMFEGNLDLVLECAKRICASTALSLYVALIQSSSAHLLTEIPQLQLPQAPDEDAFEYKAASMLGLLHAVPDSVARYEKHNVPWHMIRENLEHFEEMVDGVDILHLAYMGESLEARWFHIGNLCYELPHEYKIFVKVFKSKNGELCALSDGQIIHKSGQILGSEKCEDPDGSYKAEIIETPDSWSGYAYNDKGLVEPILVTLSKDRWTPVLDGDSLTILVHIPPKSLDPDGVSKSIVDAEAFFREHYPKLHPVAFICTSWLMETQLANILDPGSRILSFQHLFHPFNQVSDSSDLFYFVFDGNNKISSLPENTSLERGIKKYFLDGGCLRCGVGYRLIENP